MSGAERFARFFARRKNWFALVIAVITAFFAIQMRHLEIYTQFLDLLPRNHPFIRNYEAYRDQVDWGGAAEIDQMMLCDAQTSGGLLVAIPRASADAFERELATAAYPAARIGTINGHGSIRVRA